MFTEHIVLPPVKLSSADFDRLDDLVALYSRGKKVPEAISYLERELLRATVLPPEQLPTDIVAMNTVVTYLDEILGEERTVQLVFPNEADIGTGKISVLTPVGAALIGLAPGCRISWTTRPGEMRTLKILDVRLPS